MGKLNSNLDFRLMSLVIRLRDPRLPRGEILKEVEIKNGREEFNGMKLFAGCDSRLGL